MDSSNSGQLIWCSNNHKGHKYREAVIQRQHGKQQRRLPHDRLHRIEVLLAETEELLPLPLQDAVHPRKAVVALSLVPSAEVFVFKIVRMLMTLLLPSTPGQFSTNLRLTPARVGFATEATLLGLLTRAAGRCGGELTRIVGSDRSDSERNTTALLSASSPLLALIFNASGDPADATPRELTELFRDVVDRRVDARLALLAWSKNSRKRKRANMKNQI